MLKSVEEHEKQAEREKFKKVPGYPSGVACPQCGAELFRFIGGSVMLERYKGRKPCFCRKCNHETTIA